MSLKERRKNLQERERRVDDLIERREIKVDRLLAEINMERDERDKFKKRRKQLKAEFEQEIKRDEKDKGQHENTWEDWVESRRDELADLIEASESRLDRLVARAAKQDKLLKDLKERDQKLENRIERITKKLAVIKSDKPGQLTKDFHIAEFACRDGTPVPPGIVPHVKQLCVVHLQPLRDSGGSVTINSGYRTRTYNARIGGASQSHHIYDLRMKAPAADHIQSGRSASAVQQWHEGHNPFDGMGFYSGFTHGDDRGYHSRWYGVA